MNEPLFRQITADQKDLLELTLEHRRNEYVVPVQALNTAIIVEVLRSHGNLKQLHVINFPENQNSELQEQLENDWNIRINDLGVSFERKNQF